MPRQDLLSSAKIANKNEFYTQYQDIEKEVNAYVEYNKDVFRDKTILLPCDDPEWSNFTKYFSANFERFGLKKLISTSYAKGWANNHQITLFELNSPDYNEELHQHRGKLFILERDIDGSGKIDQDDIEFSYMEGDGDFRSDEVTKLRDEADFIITNPPFNTMFREFFSWVMESGKQFLFIASINSLTYKEVFPYIQQTKVWVGTGMGRWISGFIVPNDYELYGTEAGLNEKGQHIVATNNCLWLTNIDHGKRHEALQLMTMADNLRYNKTLCKRLKKNFGNDTVYPHYANYDAIEVPFTEAIPADYDGIMGVPISFMDKYNPEQFEIIGMSKTPIGNHLRTHIFERQIQYSMKNGIETCSNVTKLNDGAAILVENKPEKYPFYEVNGKLYVATYPRILIRRK